MKGAYFTGKNGAGQTLAIMSARPLIPCRVPPIQIEFRSRLTAPPADVWQWITSFKGISAEMRPLMRMSVPRGVKRLSDIDIVPGQPLFFSWILLFGVLPVDWSKLTLLEIEEGRGFVEASPMGSMRQWRHERRIEAAGNGCAIIDRLSFEPRFASPLVAWFVHRFFAHRHAVLRRHLGA